MKIAVACDHGGLEHKNAIKEYLIHHGYEVIDVGTDSKESTHYPIYAKKAAELLVKKEVDRIVLICTSGEGISITANRYKGVRVGIAYNDEVARLMRQHNDANGIAFGQKFMSIEDCLRRLDIFLNTPFEGGRHALRVAMIDNK